MIYEYDARRTMYHVVVRPRRPRARPEAVRKEGLPSTVAAMAVRRAAQQRTYTTYNIYTT